MIPRRMRQTLFLSGLAAAVCIAGPAEAGKPGPAPQPPAPALLYINKAGAVEVSNADGSAAKVVIPAGGIHRPNWAPLNSGNINDPNNPARIVFEQPICTLREIDVWVENGAINTGPIVSGVLAPRPLPRADSAVQDSACAADLNGNMLVSGEAYTETPTSDLFTMTRGADGWSTPTAIYGLPFANITSENTITWATYSPNGRYIAFVESTDRRRIKIIDTINPSSISTVLDDPNHDPAILEWSPAGNTLAFESAFGVHVMNVNFDETANSWTGTLPIKIAASAGSPTWSDSGEQIYLTASGGVSVMSKLSGSTWGNLKLLVRGASRPRYRN